ncbi:hypothetical protein INR49_000650 [Caranx melampygus]|nr:hypothetical protein INR49_000650 [Caranx melampygus]
MNRRKRATSENEHISIIYLTTQVDGRGDGIEGFQDMICGFCNFLFPETSGEPACLERGETLISRVLVVSNPLWGNGLRPPALVHPLRVGDHLQSGDLHSLPGFPCWKGLGSEAAAHTELSPGLQTTGSSVCGQLRQLLQKPL